MCQEKATVFSWYFPEGLSLDGNWEGKPKIEQYFCDEHAKENMGDKLNG